MLVNRLKRTERLLLRGAVPMLSLEDHVPDVPDRFLPRCKGIYHAGCTDYPYPNLPMPLQLGQRAR
jgi:hypothetical protein